ncbi:hypothetical protein EW026_g3113 [Hermanssonia centrifuga]|uniref:F-box domain-containing protein n=1 Tax=Hermanssonia centrifuga TaxID=98765 RepID=A0A4S4KL47_9APHY|nr:hypothetical protein EW026_g3113 [Hermanssonia centrifuga]
MPEALWYPPHDIILSPFLRLPYDVHHMFLRMLIVTLTDPDPYVPWDGYRDLLNLMSTCKTMRRFMLGTPKLWRYITVNDFTPKTISRIQEYLSKRSKGVKLFVALNLHGRHNQDSPVHALEEVCDILSPHLHRVQSFLASGLTVDQTSVIARLFKGDAKPTSSCLETLSLVSREEEGGAEGDIQLYSKMFPCLCLLQGPSLTRCIEASLHKNSLTRLSLDFGMVDRATLDSIYPLLRECPNMEELSLQEYFQQTTAVSDDDLSVGSVVLPRLKQLTVIDTEPSATRHLLTTIAYPPTVAISVSWDILYDSPWDWIPLDSPSFNDIRFSVARMEVDIKHEQDQGDPLLLLGWRAHMKNSEKPSLDVAWGIIHPEGKVGDYINDDMLSYFLNVGTLTTTVGAGVRVGHYRHLMADDWLCILTGFLRLTEWNIEVPVEDCAEVTHEICHAIAEFAASPCLQSIRFRITEGPPATEASVAILHGHHLTERLTARPERVLPVLCRSQMDRQ